MKDEQREAQKTFIKIEKFGVDEGGAFPSAGTAAFAEVAIVVASMQASGAEQSSAFGDTNEQIELKGIKRETLRNFVSETSRTAKSMRHAFPGIEEQFAMPRDRSDLGILNAGRAFVINGLPLKSEFGDYGLPGTWFVDMGVAADEFQASFISAAGAEADRAESTADMQGFYVRGLRARRILDGIAKNIFANDVGKLAAWLQASHIERPPRRTPTPTPTPPTPTPPDPADDPTP